MTYLHESYASKVKSVSKIINREKKQKVCVIIRVFFCFISVMGVNFRSHEVHVTGNLYILDPYCKITDLLIYLLTQLNCLA